MSAFAFAGAGRRRWWCAGEDRGDGDTREALDRGEVGEVVDEAGGRDVTEGQVDHGVGLAIGIAGGQRTGGLGGGEVGPYRGTPSAPLPGGTWTLGDSAVTRFGYGAMQLAGPWVMGPPADHDGALAVLREAISLGITHIDTSDAYGPRITNELIREALHPYPEPLFIATKVGATRDAQGGWPTARRPEELRKQVHENLQSLGVETLDLVNMRMGDAQAPQPGSITEAFETLVGLQQEDSSATSVSATSPARRSPKRAASPRSCACRTCTTSPTATTTTS